MELSLEQLAARLEACEADLEAHRGYIKALEYGLRAVIASHPNPQVLSLAWGMTLAGAADAHAGEEGFAFNGAMQQAMRNLTREVVVGDVGAG
ncbi:MULTISPECIES: hypothetical protein [Stenotrophomonas]|jgi:hypothetical protein|uniref:Uncharacterized protein n=2 Tax=Stenotrophomonas TaxID=40323 RepID=A0AAW4GHD6_9GAMM|nr:MULTISPECIES: hypothetical protein [Stenotrophomonas]MBM9913883.1 hypothetical protein [Stenotrophomonas lactitubi]MBM9921876.1 hypothetical protein [Stenotrophomonas lactitubi]MBM9938952.1 hypothetical protein [Stenotrophomonas lactitubi]MCX2892561.1 hypothetical protein [Stenotrophomonas lactitubi]MDV3463489.1 hypothetical protein [Stenotrophomonas sp. C960]